MQKAIVVQYYHERKNNVAELNQFLEEGWKVVSQSNMTEAGGVVYSLVIIEKN
ncbi:hypothetical protein [Paenibacillus sinopodophylli]|uniref:hypothetical protein n=1 Tax=Paenibacillus sinopodophylli TaxID=1837342 RepID=UPI0014867CEC|nr:hypothetical protein [Paenibacillus sinopodophylli]